MASSARITPSSVAATGLPTRRGALASLAGLGSAVALPMTVQAIPAHDPIPTLYTERKRTIALLDACRSDTEADPLLAAWAACDRTAIASPATTLPGAVASLAWMRDELMLFGFEGERDEKGPAIILALLDGALAVLRKEGGAA